MTDAAAIDQLWKDRDRLSPADGEARAAVAAVLDPAGRRLAAGGGAGRPRAVECRAGG